jgi:hypothetical protein
MPNKPERKSIKILMTLTGADADAFEALMERHKYAPSAVLAREAFRLGLPLLEDKV